MSIYNMNYLRNNTNYTFNTETNTNITKNNNIPSQNNSISDVSKDSINLSRSIHGIGSLGLDKGTAANTTLYVDKSTFDNIVSYSANNSEYKWDEMGFDHEKKWVVINGQRFEYPLSEEEKAAYKNASKTIVDYIIEAEEQKETDDKNKPKQEITVDSDGNLNSKNYSSDDSNEKIKNLSNNKKVMDMLKNIAVLNGGSISFYQ